MRRLMAALAIPLVLAGCIEFVESDTPKEGEGAGDVAAGEHADVWMNIAGSFVFQCRYHPGMRLTATVTE